MYSAAFIAWHLPFINIYRVGVKIANDNLFESDGCHCKLHVSRSNDM